MLLYRRAEPGGVRQAEGCYRDALRHLRRTGDYKAPFASRTRVGGGWNAYDRLLSVGDMDADGRADLVARQPKGDLYRYSGTGDAQAVYEKPVKIGHGFQIYNLL